MKRAIQARRMKGWDVVRAWQGLGAMLAVGVMVGAATVAAGSPPGAGRSIGLPRNPSILPATLTVWPTARDGTVSRPEDSASGCQLPAALARRLRREGLWPPGDLAGCRQAVVILRQVHPAKHSGPGDEGR